MLSSDSVWLSEFGKMIEWVSIHGGHSGQFCNHAVDSLEVIVQAYVAAGFSWVGITEHIPPGGDEFVYPDEQAVGLTAVSLYHRFRDYIQVGRALQQQYADRLTLYIGCETEYYTGYADHVRRLVAEFQPDYLVGSVHHLEDMSFDMDANDYWRVVTAVGGLDAFYQKYFDQQYDMIQTLRPQVIGHFDYPRIYDPDYPTQLRQPETWGKIMRNLHAIKESGAILDCNTKGWRKGHPEPYISAPILQEVLALGIPVVPGDDSHGVAEIGTDLQRGIDWLQAAGAPTNWQRPCSSVFVRVP